MITRQRLGPSLAVHPGQTAAVTRHATWLPPVRELPVSATLAANEGVAARGARSGRWW